MIKAFENCSPEYQITIICFFIFLTLLYMILVIYEGTGKRQRKMLLLDSVLLIVIFLITSGLCARQRMFKIPYVILIVMGICGFLYVGQRKKQAQELPEGKCSSGKSGQFAERNCFF